MARLSPDQELLIEVLNVLVTENEKEILQRTLNRLGSESKFHALYSATLEFMYNMEGKYGSHK